MKLPWPLTDRKSLPAHLISIADLRSARWGGTDIRTLTRKGYQHNAIAYRCVRMIAEAAASIPMVCDNREVMRLLETPSQELTGQALRENLYTDLQITGNAWAEAIALEPGGAPRGLYGVQADSIHVITDSRGHISGYKIKTAKGERVVRQDARGWLPLLHIKLYNPADPNFGLAPLMAAHKALEIHDSAACWAKALLDNAARPSGALIYGREGARLTEAQFERLKQELSEHHSGANNAGRPLLLEGGLDWRPMSLSPAEMDFHATRYAAAREIALVFGVPPMLLGIPGDNTYATYKEAHLAFWRLTILPLVQKFARALTVWLSGRFDPLQIVPRLEDIPAFSSERDALWARIGAADFLTNDEKRRLLGLDQGALA